MEVKIRTADRSINKIIISKQEMPENLQLGLCHRTSLSQRKGPGSLSLPNREPAGSENSPDKLISVGCCNFLLCFSLIVFIQDGLGKHLLQFTGWEWACAAALHAAELWLEWHRQEKKGGKI